MKISNLEKAMGSFSLHIDHFEITSPGLYGLIGPNGCGKSTTAKLIAGIIPHDAGEIDYEGLGSRDITMLPQKPYLMDDTVWGNLIYPLKVRGISPDEKLCSEYLDKIGLLRKQKQRARSLSSGEQQKLALARAMIFEPKLLIVDEALTDLDIDSLDMFERMILDIQKIRPVIWLIISHQLPHIRRLCEYIFFMADGRLETEGTADEILIRPANPLVKQYLKHETMEV